LAAYVVTCALRTYTVTSAIAHDPESSRAHRLELEVFGMTCAACANTVGRALNKVDGVHASVNFATRTATIDAADFGDTVSVEQLCAIVADAGYQATPRRQLSPTDDPAAERARDLLGRLAIAAALFVPLAALSVTFALSPGTRFTGWGWLLVALAAPIVTWAAWPFHRAAVKNLRYRNASMETLISMGITAATLWSLYSIFVKSDAHVPAGVWRAIGGSGSVYLEVAAGVTVFVLTGRYFEARAESKAGAALRELAALRVAEVSALLPDGTELLLPADELCEQQRFVVRPGQRIAADGLVVEGEAAIDMSAMTGETRPMHARPGSSVIGGTVALNGRLVVEAAAVGPDTHFAGMVRLVEEAQAGRADAQRLADRVAGVFVPGVLAIAALTAAAWLIVDGNADHTVSAALSVLLVACPCALGLATPTALMVASGRGAQLGIFFKGLGALEASRRIDTVALDKTGTLTTGRLTLTSVTTAAGWDRDDVLAWTAAVESASEHPVGLAIAGAGDPPARPVADFHAVPGSGVVGMVDGRRVKVGRPAWVARSATVGADLVAARRACESRGDTVVFVSVADQLCGAIAVADVVQESAADAVTALHQRGLSTALLTGGNAANAQAIATQVGIAEVIADLLPEGKVDVIEQLRERGRVIAMVGDGINDGPALACADLGLAIGRGTDVAIGAADVILVRDSLDSVPQALDLAHATIRTIWINMLWAFGYNLVAIPIAAAGLLNPLIASAAMAFSSLVVVSNSLRLRKFA
jgi:Cu+-exporting ATPase